MTLEQLTIFAAVAERQHMTRAAEALNLTQSAVSGAIQALENRHQVALFHRIGRRIEITPDGEKFLDRARKVLLAAGQATSFLKELKGLESGTIAIHASQTTGTYWLPQRLAKFKNRHPGIDIEVTLGNTDQVAAAVISGAAEIGFVEDSLARPELLTEQIATDELAVVVGAAHPWSRLRRVGLNQITETSWVLRERGSGTRSVFENALRKARISPSTLPVSLELPSNEMIRSAVEAGLGATAISQSVVSAALRHGTLRRVNLLRIERPFLVLRHRERTPSNAVKAFLDKE
ncbi:MAG: LysR substrate-binding domain-containing protein [Pseudolabrys sp.]